ncbi:MAG: serine/threonine protein phosphatase PphA [Rhodobacteraceae bacterium HLUCCA08]|nr:MAG: serine/threonine protein phosphatase PphA [Rhodobacteraceae bacterium HLUCCA08]
MQDAPLYAIGDIHGHSDQLDQALARIAADGGAAAPVVFLGDLVDRGPDSRGVIQRLIDGGAAGRDWTVLLGNHDRMFLRFVRDGLLHDDRILSGKGWLHPALGGAATLASYGVQTSEDSASALDEARAAVPRAHLDFLAARPLWAETASHIFVHAGIRPGVAMDRQDPDDLVWIRDPFLDWDQPFAKTVVHGHTALDHPRHEGNRVNLDGGAGYGRPLFPAVFDGADWHLLTETGRELLWPRT